MVLTAGSRRPRSRCHAPGRGDEQRADDERGDRHMREPVRKRRVEDDLEPVERHDVTVLDREALRRLHPAIGGENPEGRDQRADRDHQRGAEVRAPPHALPAEQHDAEKARFEKEGGHHLVSEQRTGDRAGEARKARPVRAELIAHHDAGDDAHAEADREDLRPEQTQFFVVRLAGFQTTPLRAPR